MVQIIATPEQAELLRSVNESVIIVDAAGQRLGSVTPEFTAEEITEARQRAASDEPRRTTQQVMERLHSSDAAE